MDDTRALEQRLQRLRQELLDELRLQLSTEILEELAYAKYMDAHEGQRPTYGAVIWLRPIMQENDSSTTRQLIPSPAGYVYLHDDISLIRKFADGRTAFVVRAPGARPLLIVDPEWNGSESALAKYAHANVVAIVQRMANSRIRLFVKNSVFVEDGGMWLPRVTALNYEERLRQLFTDSESSIVNTILNLCVHVLSPAGNGATLVWFPEGIPAEDSYLDRSVAVTPPNLSAANLDHASAISHVLGQMDRAVIRDNTGTLVAINVTLTHDDWFGDSTFSGGTRHISAWRYSASQPMAVVFVVSADGPVTVMHRGVVWRSND